MTDICVVAMMSLMQHRLMGDTEMASHEDGDHMTLLKMYRTYNEIRNQTKKVEKWCKSRGIRSHEMELVRKKVSEFLQCFIDILGFWTPRITHSVGDDS